MRQHRGAVLTAWGGGTRGGRRSSAATDIDDWDDASIPIGGYSATVDRAANENVFELGGGGTGPTKDTPEFTAPPREITQQWTQHEGSEETNPTDRNNMTHTATEATAYSGIGAAIGGVALARKQLSHRI